MIIIEGTDSGGVYITHSTNGGISWTSPVQIWNAFTEDPTKTPLDRPWLSIDNSGGINDGMFYLTTKPAPWISGPNRPYLKTSLDSGQTWSPYRYVDTTNYLTGNINAPMGALANTADGALCIAYPSYLTSQSLTPKYFLAKSYNRGTSFQYYDLLVNPASLGGGTNYKLGYNLTANPSNPNQLAFAFIANTYGDPDVFLTTSNNGGVTWNTPVKVNDDLTGNGKAQDMVWVNYNQNNKLLVTWRDRRNGTGTGFYQPSDTYGAVSIDNGASFKPNIQLNSIIAPFDSVLEESGNDFLSCEFLNDTIYAAWGDVRTGKLNIYFTKTSDSLGTSTSVVTVDGNQNEALSVYPNPTSDKLVISFYSKQVEKIELTIFNENGQKVMIKEIENVGTQTTVDLSRLAAGAYFVKATTNQRLIYNNKIIVVK